MINACQLQEKKEQKTDENMINSFPIENIVFQETYTNPNIKNYKELSIDINFSKKKAYRISVIYENEKKIKSDTIKSIDILGHYKKKLSQIPAKYLDGTKNDYVFGSLNEADEGYLIVTFKIKNKKPIFWSLSYFKDEHPKEIQLVYGMYEEFQQKLNKK